MIKINIKLILIYCLIETIIILTGLTISRTFISGLTCGMIYWFVTDLIELYLKEREEK